MKSWLLCTFSTVQTKQHSLDQIVGYCSVSYSDIECFEYVEQPTNLILIFNSQDRVHKLQNTIAINRKRLYNSFYSINALNKIIEHEQGSIRK